MSENIGYLKLVERSPSRTWELYDAKGQKLDKGHCVDLTQTAWKYNMQIVTVH